MIAPVVALGFLLVSAGIEDARIREIANWKNAAIALLAPLWWWSQGLEPWPGMAIQIGIAAIVLAIFVGAFACGWMGGGDVKLIAALALWLPIKALLDMLMVMSIAGGAVTVAMMIDRTIRRRRTGAEPTPVEVPYGVAIAIAALLALPQTQF